MISFLGGIVIGFSVPFTGQQNGHVCVDFLVVKMRGKAKNILTAATKLLSLLFFIVVAYSLTSMGLNFRASHEVSQTMKLPFYPVALCLGGMFMVQSFQLLLDVVLIVGGKKDE